MYDNVRNFDDVRITDLSGRDADLSDRAFRGIGKGFEL